MKIISDLNKINGQDKINDVKKRTDVKGKNFGEILKDNQVAKDGSSVKDAKSTEKLINTDSVKFSSEAEKVKLINDAVKNTPDIRQDKVDDIKSRIKDGTYNVSADKLAQKLMDIGLADKLLRG